jgi:hypothetical protein
MHIASNAAVSIFFVSSNQALNILAPLRRKLSSGGIVESDGLLVEEFRGGKECVRTLTLPAGRVSATPHQVPF